MKYSFLFLLCYTGILCAQTTFQKHFPTCGLAATYASETDEGYFILGTTGGLGCISFTLLDTVGNIIRTNELRLNNAGVRAWDQALVQDENGDFLILCEIVDTVYRIIDPYLIKVSGTTLDTLWTKRYRTNEGERCRAIQKYKDGYLLLAQTSKVKEIDSTFYRDTTSLLFIQTDREGEILKQVVVRDTFKFCFATSFGIVTNNEIAVGYDADDEFNRAAGYVGLLDTAFNFKWKKKLDDRDGDDIPKILISKEKDKIYVTSQSNKFFPNIGSYDASGNIDAFNLFGNLHWRTELYRGAWFEIEQGDIASNDDIINCGYLENSVSSGYTKDYGRIFRLSSNGDILWDRLYRIPNARIGHGQFYSVIETKDGGILAVGHMVNSNLHDFELYVLKLNANGCLKPTCDSIIVPLPFPHPSGTRDAAPNQNLKVYPNPSTGIVNFVPKENRVFFKEDRLIINDLSGKKIKEIIIQSQTNELIWNAENQPPGIYFYRLFSEGTLKESGRVVIQK